MTSIAAAPAQAVPILWRTVDPTVSVGARDGSYAGFFSSPQPTQDIHRALLYRQTNLGPGFHSFKASFESYIAVRPDGSPCFEIDFLR